MWDCSTIFFSTFGLSGTEFVCPGFWHFDNGATSKFDDVLLEHGGLEEFSKVTAAKEKDRTSVKFHDKTTNSQKFRTKLRTALPKSPELTCQLTSLTFGTKVRTLYKTTNSQARFT